MRANLKYTNIIHENNNNDSFSKKIENFDYRRCRATIESTQGTY